MLPAAKDAQNNHLRAGLADTGFCTLPSQAFCLWVYGPVASFCCPGNSPLAGDATCHTPLPETWNARRTY